ncbi:uncharacterized protein LOC122320712 [Drosophila ficusphila]|uniref:uncharacterized protein LOC122320712 n=1 Tax=Drosophila ficusphila TaxID=30025 RepID=UPI001C892C78|nr:uncharacterized protein LOC122320712 [Drosophila ficusphila]
MISTKIRLPWSSNNVPLSQLILTVLLCLIVFFGLAKLVSIPLRIDDFDSFRLNPAQDAQLAGQGFGKSEMSP